MHVERPSRSKADVGGADTSINGLSPLFFHTTHFTWQRLTVTPPSTEVYMGGEIMSSQHTTMAPSDPSPPGHQPQDPTSSEPSVAREVSRPPEIRKHSHHTSISSRHSSHQEYIDSLPVPPPSELARIESVQLHKQDEKLQGLGSGTPDRRPSEEGRHAAAQLIQRNYRGYRERRQMRGWGLDSGSRWVEAFKEARYRHLTTPRPRSSLDEFGSRPGTAGGGSDSPASGMSASEKRLSEARANWNKVGTIVRRAANDEDSSSESSGLDETAGEIRRLRREKKEERMKSAMTMDLQYWLEMVDVRHRYGSNLRTYHQEWQRAETNENFFYWLDYGEGRMVECAGCPRDRLERERVRYLSKEERLDYLVMIDGEGRLCWAKDGARIDTTTKYRDSLHGIVPIDSDAPMFQPSDGDHSLELLHTTSSSSSSNSETEAAAQHYATDNFDNARGVRKVKHVSPATIFNKLLRSSVKKNTWIFVADTNFRLYVGIKQSGAFQHSSFLHGSRISAAGLIKIKDGRLDKLSPLSGHYRPPVSSFRAFVHALREGGVDMSHVSISRSYAVLVGLEAYVKTRRRGKRVVGKLLHGRDKILSPDEVRKKEEEERDKSESAERERRVLELQREEEGRGGKADMGFLKRLHIGITARERGRGGEEGGV
ncbi:hypothetical protein V496_09725 [Pseudogymnoascus sp. VKM F-4515 (FW-2607)]|nr:hypothetical protein V496_09725 [Pseudogymnoascus sp. VKM F-4515 (FW-2607)]KFY92395.1 hypothetical protein V498_04995 [Pseudogymnoascus sp. VKM F-4517 (FW-2822)]